MKEILDQIQGIMGDLGMPPIQIGSQCIQAAPREDLKTLKGFGDTVQVGDVVEVTKIFNGKTFVDPIPQKITIIIQGSEGPNVAFRDFDDGPMHKQRSVPLAGPPTGDSFRNSFRLLTENEIAAWYETNRRLPDGWHDIYDGWENHGKIMVENGIPTQVQRPHVNAQMAYVVEMAEQISGFDLVVSRTYADSAKTLASVKKQTRRNASRFSR